MLINLVIKDFGLVGQADIRFGAGFNVLTGETGAGKSIILEALQVVLGGRASAEFIRTGAERAVVQGIFDAAGLPMINEKLNEAGIVPEEDGTLIMVREINKNGRNLCRINGLNVPLNQYRILGSMLMDMQGQHEQQTLLDQERQLDLLDSFGGREHKETAARLEDTYRKWRGINTELTDWRGRTADIKRRADYIKYQLEEIDAAGLSPGEFEDLQRERNILANAEKIKRLVAECHALLHGGGQGPAPAVDLLDRSCRYLEQLSELDSHMATHRETLTNCLYQIEDVARELSGYLDSVDFNSLRLEAVEGRLAKIESIMKKYGGSVEDVIKYRAEIAAEFDSYENSGDRIAGMERELDAQQKEWNDIASRLSGLRKKAAMVLEKSVSAELAELEMGKADFKVNFLTSAELSEKGRERVEYLISPNPGEPLRPMARIASGGELSRILLAVKTILAEVEDVPTLVFDEVDAGIGGRALQAVAEKLAGLGQKRQLVCVTHAAAVAARAMAHHHIYKEEQQGRTVTRVKELTGDERVGELARMLGGRDYEGVAMEHARQMINNA